MPIHAAPRAIPDRPEPLPPGSLSVVLPAYNEARRIVQSLQKIERYLAEQSLDWEVLVVDDGSADATAALVEQHAAASAHGPRLHLLRNGCNRGKGFSVRAGFLAARHELVLFSDSDLSAPIEELAVLLQPLQRRQADGAIGSRAVPGADIQLHQPFYRECGGKFFNLLMRLLTGLRFHDTQCGFKLFRREPFLSVFQRQRIEGFAFDVEILFIAARSGLRVAEIPVRWAHCEDSKVHFLRDALRMILELLRIRWHQLRGCYRIP